MPVTYEETNPKSFLDIEKCTKKLADCGTNDNQRQRTSYKRI